jgi:hypothetical protein
MYAVAPVEDVCKLHPHLEALVTEADVHPQERLIVVIEPEAEPDIGFKLAQREIGLMLVYLARIREECHVEPAEYLPSVLGRHDEQVRVAKTERAISA